MEVLDALDALGALDVVAGLGPDSDQAGHAAAIGLTLSDDDEPGITRVGRGRGFSFHRPDGSLVEGEERERCLALAVPPAWTDVWICVEDNGHLQATGRDDAGRKQYLYHDSWRALREAVKFSSLPRFGEALPHIRARVDSDLRRRRLDRDRVLGLTIAVLDATLLRVGSEDHADEDGGHGLTTLAPDHLEVGTTVATFSFLGKSGVEQHVTLRDRRLVRQLGQMKDVGLPQLLGWEMEDGSWRDVRRDDVTAHLRAITGADISAKDFRTWGGSARALGALLEAPPCEDERELDAQRLAAVDAAADALGNTRAVARASYVHPGVLDAHGSGVLRETFERTEATEHLSRVEATLLALLA